MTDPFDGMLDEGDRVLWSGRPEPYGLADCYQFLIAALVLGIGVWLFAKAPVGDETFGCFVASGIVSICFGLLIAILFWRELLARKHTHYAITCTKVILVTDVFRKSVLTTRIADIPVVHKSVRRDGVGTLAFGSPSTRLFSVDPANRRSVRRDWGRANYHSTTPVFYDIKDAEAVDGLVNRLRMAAGASSEVPYR